MPISAAEYGTTCKKGARLAAELLQKTVHSRPQWRLGSATCGLRADQIHPGKSVHHGRKDSSQAKNDPPLQISSPLFGGCSQPFRFISIYRNGKMVMAATPEKWSTRLCITIVARPESISECFWSELELWPGVVVFPRQGDPVTTRSGIDCRAPAMLIGCGVYSALQNPSVTVPSRRQAGLLAGSTFYSIALIEITLGG